MADAPILLGPDGQPIRRELLTQEVAKASIGSVRSPMSGYPADGLDPRRLANLLRDADQGDPLRFFELAEQIEERDPHYAGILGTRKRSVSQLDIQVDAADDTPEAKMHADMIATWLGREELESELFDMLDAIGKGISFTEILWDTSEGQWMPTRLEWRDPRWFRFDTGDGTTPLLIGGYDGDGVGDVGGGSRLPAFKFVTTVIRAKSGLPIRSGIARLAAWSWMFKAYTQRDWAIFTQTFGQPVRVGKYPAGSSQADKDTLFNAVKYIAGDCAAIIPESMLIEFIESANVGQSHTLYKERCDWLDQQMSKAVLGQTATTDAIAGGHAVGQEHRQVQEDIESADAKALSAIINRDLVRPWVQLEFGPQKKYPRLRIGRPDSEDLTQLVTNVVRVVPLGVEVEKSWMRDKLGIPEPAPGAPILTAPVTASPFGFGPPSLQSVGAQATADQIATLTRNAEDLCGPGVDGLIAEIRNVVARSASLAQLQSELKKMKPGLAEVQLAGLVRYARVIANLTGRADLDA